MCCKGQEDSGFLSAGDQGGKSSAHRISTNEQTYIVSAMSPSEKSIHCSFLVDGIDTRFMADTGAEITLLPESHPSVERLRSCCLPTQIQPVTVDGKPIPLLGTLTLEVSVHGTNVPHTFFITQGTQIQPILGLDFMRKLGEIKIDFRQGGHITFGEVREDHSVDEAEGHHVKAVCRIAVQLAQDVNLPPRHEKVVMGKLVTEGSETFSQLDSETLLVEPVHKEDGNVVWGRALVTARQGQVPIRVCNPSFAEVVLPAGKSVGSAEFLPENPLVAVVSEDIMMADTGNEGSSDVLLRLQELAEVTPEEKRHLSEFLATYKKAFSLKGELGHYDGRLFKIDTGNAHPVRCMPRPVPHHKKVEIDRQIDDMLSRGLIEPTDSEWASPVLMVKKNDGSLRFCIDYRRLNDITKHDAFPLPNINDCLASLGKGCGYFSSLDLASGYWQMGMDKESQEKAAFTTHRGLFKPLVQPFGPKGGVAHFSRVMDSLLGSLQWKILLIYLDDILVFGKDFQEHLHRLGLVLQTLIKANLKLKPEKCNLFRKSVRFLGHVISDKGIQPDPDKLKSVREWPVPTGKDEVRSFLGFLSYYRRYVKNFALLAEPLIALTRKNAKFKWDADCEMAFVKLRHVLIDYPILAYPDFTQPFVLTTDASATGLGAVLSQGEGMQEKVIAFASRTLTKAERNYSATERECLGVIWATENFEYYLLGAPFVIYTDHDPLTYLRSVPQPHGRLARWILKLERFEYQLRHKAGKSISHADGLSRQAVQVTAISLPEMWSIDEFRDAQSKDRVLRRVKYFCKLQKQPSSSEDPSLREYCRKMDLLEDREGVLICRYEGKAERREQVVVPEVLIPRVLENFHDKAGHFGSEKTLQKVRQHFFWASMFKDVAAWCKTCRECQLRKHPPSAAKAPVQYMPVASEPGQLLCMDFVGPLPETPNGNKHMLVVTDAFSKYSEVIALPNQTAEVTANALIQECFSRQGVPSILHSDQGRNFESEVIQHLCQRLGIEKTRTSGYHPAGNGGVERYNKTLIERLSLMLERDDQTDWEDHIPQALFDYHNAVHCSTGMTPAQLHFGRALRSPFDTLALTPVGVKGKSAREYFTTLQKRIVKQQGQARQKLMQSMEERKLMHDKRLHYNPYVKGDLVMCRNFTCAKGLKPKLIKERWTGPWKVIQVRGPVNYRITRKAGGKTHRVLVHHDRLKLFHERPKHLEPVKGSDIANHTQTSKSDSRDQSATSREPEELDMESLLGDDGASSDNEDPFEDAVEDIDPAPLPGGDLLEPNGVVVEEADLDQDNLGGLDEVDIEVGPGQQGDAEPPILDQYPTTRSGREVKPPKRLVAEPNFGLS